MNKIKGIVLFALTLAYTIKQDLIDKKISLTEAFGLLPQVMKIPELVADLPTVKEEWKNRTIEQLEELTEFVKSNFDIDDDKIEAVIEAGLDSVEKLVVLIDKVGDLKVKEA